jgi:hypothetical protein
MSDSVARTVPVDSGRAGTLAPVDSGRAGTDPYARGLGSRGPWRPPTLRGVTNKETTVPDTERELGDRIAPVDVDRLVAGAAQWDEYVSARVALRRTPGALVDELDFVADLVERDRASA